MTELTHQQLRSFPHPRTGDSVHRFWVNNSNSKHFIHIKYFLISHSIVLSIQTLTVEVSTPLPEKQQSHECKSSQLPGSLSGLSFPLAIPENIGLIYCSRTCATSRVGCQDKEAEHDCHFATGFDFIPFLFAIRPLRPSQGDVDHFGATILCTTGCKESWFLFWNSCSVRIYLHMFVSQPSSLQCHKVLQFVAVVPQVN